MNETTTTATIGRPGLHRLFAPRPDYLRHPLKVWPYTWRSLAQFAVAFLVLTAIWTGAGFAVVEWVEPSSIGQAETDLSVWFEEQRTPTRTTIAEIASMPSDTWVKVGMFAVLLVVFPLVFRRWHEWAFLLGALVLEVCVYGASSYLVGRPRPPVEQLTQVPTESFPSGHMAAATAFYLGLVLVVYWNTPNTVWRAVAWFFGALIPVGMFVSRLYLGMHYVSDMIGGFLLGLTCLVIALNIARDGLEDTVDDADELLPPHTTELDLVEEDGEALGAFTS